MAKIGRLFVTIRESNPKLRTVAIYSVAHGKTTCGDMKASRRRRGMYSKFLWESAAGVVMENPFFFVGKPSIVDEMDIDGFLLFFCQFAGE